MDVRRAGSIMSCVSRTGVPTGDRLGDSVRGGLAATLVCGVSLLVLALPAVAADLVSVSITGRSGAGASSGPAADTNGHIVAFYSDARDLVPGDTNGVRDVFVRDRATGITERVSVNSTGQQANGASQATGNAPAISNNGDVVVFYSDATNLVSGDTNGQTDIFVRTRSAGTTERVSVSTGGVQGNGPSVNPAISANGRFVVFQSQASNLVAGDTNNASDIFVRDLVGGTTERVCDSVQPNRFSYSPAISGDGNLVAFASAATNLVPGDTNGKLDIFVCDRSSGVIERVSVGNAGQGDGDSILPAISANGLVVAFKSLSTNLVPNDSNGVVDVFARDRSTGTTERISVNNLGGDANDFSFPPSVSDDGRFVAFGSFATNLVGTDVNNAADVFVRDRRIGVTVLADVTDLGQQANGGTPDVPPGISGDGMQVSFASFATNLALNDTNQVTDVFAAINPFFGPGGCPDGMCPAGQVCTNGFCAVPTPTPTSTRTPTATRTGTPTKTPTATPTFKVCTDDSMCPPDQHCRGGFCKKERPCDNPDMCFDREACLAQQCECGGDCNLDGFVLVNEVNKAIRILNNLAPLDQCSAADINGDGQVMGNEITLAVLNLSEGCIQEGQPLIFAHDRGGMVTLTVGSATAAGGGSATIAIGLSGGEGEVATAQLDLLFDPNALQIDDPGSACVKDPRLTEHVMSATLPNAPDAPNGLRRLRLFIGDLSAPIASFADGPIAACTFQVKPGATGAQIVLGADRLNVGDARGNVFGSQAISGGLSILVPTPTPVQEPVVRPFCPGDCDGDGQVLVTEITTAVRILSNEAPLSDCPAADADGDGAVYVTDVTRAVISLGLGCPQ